MGTALQTASQMRFLNQATHRHFTGKKPAWGFFRKAVLAGSSSFLLLSLASQALAKPPDFSKPGHVSAKIRHLEKRNGAFEEYIRTGRAEPKEIGEFQAILRFLENGKKQCSPQDYLSHRRRVISDIRLFGSDSAFFCKTRDEGRVREIRDRFWELSDPDGYENSGILHARHYSNGGAFSLRDKMDAISERESLNAGWKEGELHKIALPSKKPKGILDHTLWPVLNWMFSQLHPAVNAFIFVVLVPFLLYTQVFGRKGWKYWEFRDVLKK